MRRSAVVRRACVLAFAGGFAVASCSGGSGGGAAAAEPSAGNPVSPPIGQPATGLACTLLKQGEVEQALSMPIAAIEGTEASAMCSWQPKPSAPALDVALNDDPTTGAAQYAQQRAASAVPDDGDASSTSGTVTDTQLGDKAFFLDKPSVVELYVVKGGKLMMLRLHTNDYPAFATGAHDTLTSLAGLALDRY